nr:hypothetical protein [Tanacetum cinerariifolium]
MSNPMILDKVFSLTRVTEARLKDQAAPATINASKTVTNIGNQKKSTPRVGITSSAVNENKPSLLPTPPQMITNANTKPLVVKPDVMEKMRLAVQTTKAFKVYIGIGESLLCENICSQGINQAKSCSSLGGVDFAKSGDAVTLSASIDSPPFQEPDVMEKMCLAVQTTKAFKVYIRIGESLLCENICSQKDASYHFCVDYQALNEVTIKDKFTILIADEMFDELGGEVIFSKSDLRVGYHQIRVHERNVVDMDPKKVAAIREWPMPKSQWRMPGFLRLVRYYRRFIEVYATMAAPLTDLLHKDGFSGKTRS